LNTLVMMKSETDNVVSTS